MEGEMCIRDRLTAIVGDSGSGKSTILNLIAKYYEANGGTISIGGKPINHVAAERVLEQISMVDPVSYTHLSCCGHAALCTYNSGGLAFYQRRYADAGCIT